MVEYGTFLRTTQLSIDYNNMNTVLTGVRVSPVNMDDRKSLGIKAGDTVKVHQKIEDKGKTRIQIFEGLVLARKHGDEPGATFTVRKMASGVGVEKIFPLYSPMIDKIEISKRAKVRRAKLYYIREKVAREIKRQMRRMNLIALTTESGIEVAAKAELDAKEAEATVAKAEAERVVAEQAKAEEEAKKAEATAVEDFKEEVTEVTEETAEVAVSEEAKAVVEKTENVEEEKKG